MPNTWPSWTPEEDLTPHPRLEVLNISIGKVRGSCAIRFLQDSSQAQFFVIVSEDPSLIPEFRNYVPDHIQLRRSQAVKCRTDNARSCHKRRTSCPFYLSAGNPVGIRNPLVLCN